MRVQDLGLRVECGAHSLICDIALGAHNLIALDEVVLTTVIRQTLNPKPETLDPKT